MLRILEQLSYRQISILAYCYDVEMIQTDRWMISFKDIEELRLYQDFNSEIMDLYNQQLLQQAGGGISLSVGALKISPLGRTMCELIDIKDVDSEDKGEVQMTVESINNILRKRRNNNLY